MHAFRAAAERKRGADGGLQRRQADDRQVIAVSTKGDGELWRDRWQNRFVWGWFDSAANGSRFVYESIQVNRSISMFDSLYPEDVQAQMVGVYDTETGSWCWYGTRRPC